MPGGTAAYPSTVLMDVIPAKVAGVDEIVMTTSAGKDGRVNPVILAAAATAGVTKIFQDRRRTGCGGSCLRHPEHPRGG